MIRLLLLLALVELSPEVVAILSRICATIQLHLTVLTTVNYNNIVLRILFPCKGTSLSTRKLANVELRSRNLTTHLVRG